MSRYIDADKLKDIKFNSISKDKYGIYRMGWNDAIDAVVDNEPTADVRENVKGRWVEVVDRTEMYDKEGVKTWGMLFQCNQCGFVLNAVEGHTGQYNYCPNCGCLMKGVKNDG